MRAVRNTGGLTLLEAVIALALWMVLATGLLALWYHSGASSSGLIRQREALENARIAMDGLITNMQLASEIDLHTLPGSTMRRLTLTQLNPQGRIHNYVFSFNTFVVEGSPRQHLLFFGNNEFARNIRNIEMFYIENSHMEIKITTACEPPLIIEGSADVRYKRVSTR